MFCSSIGVSSLGGGGEEGWASSARGERPVAPPAPAVARRARDVGVVVVVVVGVGAQQKSFICFTPTRKLTYVKRTENKDLNFVSYIRPRVSKNKIVDR